MILDGYGLNEKVNGNAVAEAKTPVMDKLMAAVTMQELHDLLMADTEKTASLLAGELSAVKTYAKELYQNSSLCPEKKKAILVLTLRTI